MDDLNPCPHCRTGRNLAIDSDNQDETSGKYWVCCYVCGFVGPIGAHAAEAIAHWNSMSPDYIRRVLSCFHTDYQEPEP